MVELVYHKGKMLLPESFDECSGKQFIRLCEILFTGGDELRCQVNALKILCRKSALRFLLLRPEIINRAIEYATWVFDKEKTLTKQLIPSYKGYHAPASNFDNLRMKEFHLSEMYYRELVKEENEDREASLNNLVAVLYRLPKKGYDTKRNPQGDIRVDFNEHELPFHANRISRWPANVKQAISLWYAGCRKELEDQNPLVFKDASTGDFESQFDTGMYGVMRNLAGDKMGPIEKIETMYVWTAMLEIGLIKEEENYYKEKMKTTA